ncbi:MAG TPA: TetR family transcriptional regulator [Pseudonocardia sp.]|nr:TetR family transcriptional regulator [Pseudonocardia sp.]
MAGTTSGGAQQREAFLAGAVEHVLRHGVATLSLRPLAAALGTSDRMLLYYFRSRDELLAAVLAAVGEQLRAGLEQALPPEPVAPATLLERAWAALRTPAAEPHLRLYVEVSGLAARGLEPYGAMASQVARQWLDWTAARLDVPVDERTAAAAGLLTLLDGLLLVRFVASDAVATDAVAWLAPRLG